MLHFHWTCKSTLHTEISMNRANCMLIPMSLDYLNMVPTGSDESQLRTFQGPFQDQISCCKDIYGEVHNADMPKIYHIYVVTFCFLDFGTPHLTLQSMNFGIAGLLAILITCLTSGMDSSTCFWSENKDVSRTILKNYWNWGLFQT